MSDGKEMILEFHRLIQVVFDIESHCNEKKLPKHMPYHLSNKKG